MANLAWPHEIIKDGLNGFICKNQDEYIKMIHFSIKNKWDKDLIIHDIDNRFNLNKILNEYSDILKSI